MTTQPASSSSPAALGTALKRSRKGHGFTLGDVSARCGVDKGTLSRWENGKTLPRITELTRVLDLLGISGEERRSCFASIDAPRALKLLSADETATLPVGTGEMLRALRLRAGRSQSEAAMAAGVTQGLVSRWENGDILPDAAAVHALCHTFGATQEEVVLLTVGSGQPNPDLPRDRRAILGEITRLFDWEPTPHLDLAFLALAARFQTMLRQGEVDRFEADGVWGYLADFLVWRHGRRDEANRIARAPLRALEAEPERPLISGHWCAVQAVIWGSIDSGRSDRALAYLRRFLPRARGFQRQAFRIMLGETLSRAGAFAEAETHFRDAIARAPDELCEVAWRQCFADALLREGRYDEALGMLAPPSPRETRPSVLLGNAMTRAWALAGSGDGSGAEQLYRQTLPHLGQDLSPEMARRVDGLERLLHR